MRINRRSLAAITLGLLAGTAIIPARAAQPGTLVVAQSFDPVSLWPNWSTTQEEINVSDTITESLFWMDPKTGKTEPILAEGYDLIDPKTVRIRLRKGVKFTNGEPFDADAVVHSFTVFADAKVTPSYARYAIPIDRVVKQDDSTVILHLKFANPALDLLLSQVFITPPKYWAEVGAAGFGKKPVGTGPFKLAEWVRDSRIVVEANTGYWGVRPAGIDRIIFRPVPDDTARAAGLLAGEYDTASNISISVASQIKAQGNLDLISVPSYRIFMLGLSNLPTTPGPMQDKRVRQAVNYAIDKEAIINSLFNGQARALSGQVLRSNQMGFDPSIKDYPFDPKRAKALLAEAGFPNGFEFTFKFPSGRYVQDREVAEAIAGMLADVGIKAKMVSLEAGEFLRQLINHELAPAGYMGLAPNDDPDAQMSQFRSDWRYSYVANPKLDELIDAGAREMDKDKRTAIYREAGKLMNDEASVAFLFQSVDIYGTSRRVKGFLPRGDQRWMIYGVSLDK